MNKCGKLLGRESFGTVDVNGSLEEDGPDQPVGAHQRKATIAVVDGWNQLHVRRYTVYFQFFSNFF